jgi:hypothetical protein
MGSLLSFVKKNDHRINTTQKPIRFAAEAQSGTWNFIPQRTGDLCSPIEQGTASPKVRGILRQHKALGQAPAIIRRENWQGIQDIKVQLSRTIEYS